MFIPLNMFINQIMLNKITFLLIKITMSQVNL